MPKQQLGIGLRWLCYSPPLWALAAAIECGGQYECLEDRPLTPAEARAGLGYPHVAQPHEPTRQDPAKVAATFSTTTT
jgi:hypothetical protein